MDGVEALLPAEHAFEAFGQSVLEGLLEVRQGRMLAAAEGTGGFDQGLGQIVDRRHVFPLGGGAEVVDAVGEVGDNVLPALAFGSGDPGVLEAVGIDAEHGQELLEHFQATAGIVVAGGVVAVAGMAAGHQNAVSAVDERLEDEEGVHAAGAGDADDAKVGGLNGTGSTSRVSAAVGAPVTQKTYDTELFAG